MATNKKGKGKVSKNQKGGKTNFVPEKRVKPKKPILYIELVDSVLAEVMEESGMVEVFRNRKILRVEKRFGKNYIVLDNTEEISAI